MTRTIGMRRLRRLLLDQDAPTVQRLYGRLLSERAANFLADWEHLDRDIQQFHHCLQPAPEFQLPADFVGPDPVAPCKQPQSARVNPLFWAGPLSVLALAAVLALIVVPFRISWVERHRDGTLEKPSVVRGTDEGNDMPALFLAIRNGKADEVKFQLRTSDQLTLQDEDGNHALHLAAWHDRVSISSILLEAGAPVDITNNMNRTALMQAAFRGNEEIVRLLLERGADANALDSDLKTASDLAEIAGYQRVIVVLAEYTSQPNKVRSSQ